MRGSSSCTFRRNKCPIILVWTLVNSNNFRFAFRGNATSFSNLPFKPSIRPLVIFCNFLQVTIHGVDGPLRLKPSKPTLLRHQQPKALTSRLLLKKFQQMIYRMKTQASTPYCKPMLQFLYTPLHCLNRTCMMLHPHLYRRKYRYGHEKNSQGSTLGGIVGVSHPPSPNFSDSIKIKVQ